MKSSKWAGNCKWPGNFCTTSVFFFKVIIEIKRISQTGYFDFRYDMSRSMSIRVQMCHTISYVIYYHSYSFTFLQNNEYVEGQLIIFWYSTSFLSIFKTVLVLYYILFYIFFIHCLSLGYWNWPPCILMCIVFQHWFTIHSLVFTMLFLFQCPPYIYHNYMVFLMFLKCYNVKNRP